MASATRSARHVLPVPPTSVSVTRRVVGPISAAPRRARSSAASDEQGAGRRKIGWWELSETGPRLVAAPAHGWAAATSPTGIEVTSSIMSTSALPEYDRLTAPANRERDEG
jgi:hypothetical protein